MDKLLFSYRGGQDTMVFISDGAPWIGNWIKEQYPQAVQILDFFHAMKHIGDYLDVQYGKGQEKLDMIEYWGHILKNQGLEVLKKHLRKEVCQTKLQREAKKKLNKYIVKNEYRMNYPEYLLKGYMIGSGAIESAHRTVIQRRMQLSGQRWSIKGAQYMLDLRSLAMSGHWNLIEQYFGKMAA